VKSNINRTGQQGTEVHLQVAQKFYWLISDN